MLASNVGHKQSQYRQVLEETATTRQDANRWQTIADKYKYRHAAKNGRKTLLRGFLELWLSSMPYAQ